MSEKQKLQKMIADLKAKKYREGEAKGLMSSIQEEQTKALQPVLEKITADLSEKVREAISSAVANIKVDIPKIEIPPIDVKYPDIPAPIVNVAAPNVKVQPSQVQFPEFPKFPEFKFPERMSVLMDGVDNKRPLPVMMMDLQGRPMQFPVGASGGKADFLTIKGFSASAYSDLQNADGRLKVSVETGGSGLTDSELRASSVPVAQASDSLWSVAVKEIFGSTVTALFNGDNRIPVSVETGGSGLTDSELRASSVPVAQASDALWSVQVKEIFGSTATDVVNPDGRLKVELPSGASGLTDTELRASSVPVEQVSGSAWSVYATGFGASVGATLLNGDGTYRDTFPVTGTVDLGATDNAVLDAIASSVAAIDTDTTTIIGHVDGIETLLGTIDADTGAIMTAVQLIDNAISGTEMQTDVLSIIPGTAATNLGKAEDSAHTSGDVGVMALGVANESNTARAANNDYVPLATDTEGNQRVVGNRDHDAVDAGEVVKVGGVARTTNPTAVASGDRVQFHSDDLGRQVNRPIQVRDLIHTAYVSVTGGTETTLRAAVAGACLDLIMIVGSNNSDAAVSVDIRPVTAGNIINTLRIPANGTAGWTPPVPWPQSEQGNNWTVDGPDETGRTLTFSALFSQEI